MWNAATALEAVLKRDRAIVLSGLVGITILAWLYTISLSHDVTHAVGGHAAIAHPQLRSLGAVDLTLLFVMWIVMMIAMMVPTATQMILTFATIERKNPDGRNPVRRTAIFLLGYVVAWSLYAALATLGQWGLLSAALVSPIGVSESALFGGALLIAAGIFQWTPLKHACLARCRSPFAFLMTEWRSGDRGALRMGWRHGIYCVVCCWALMLLMFVLGMMNILWLAALTAFVMLEKAAPGGHLVGHLAGVGLVGWGIYLLGLGLLG